MKINSEDFQKIKMCAQTFFNLYGVKPTVKDLVAWLGKSYEKQIPRCMGMLCVA